MRRTDEFANSASSAPSPGTTLSDGRRTPYNRSVGQFVDDRYFPLVVVTFPEQPDLEFAEAFIREAERPITRREPKVTLIDASRTRSLGSALVRNRLGTWARQHDKVVQEFSLGAAFVIVSSLARGALTAVLWIAPPTCPTEVTATAVDGFSYLRRQYEQRFGPSAALERYQRERLQVVAPSAPLDAPLPLDAHKTPRT
jgi:hypothetical protein